MNKKVENEQILALLHQVKDPELPMVDIVGLGMVRSVEVSNNHITVVLTPTYMGCPAMQMIEEQVITLLNEHGFRDVDIRKVYAPAWSTDWMSADARAKLKEMGIAPPLAGQTTARLLTGKGREKIACPYCDSDNTEMKSAFGSTACKALYFCNGCHQPFEYFKCH